MVVDVSVHTVDPMKTTLGNSFNAKSVLCLQQMFPPKPFDKFPPESGHSEGLDDAFTFYLSELPVCSLRQILGWEGFNDWGGRGYDDFVPGEVTKTAPSGNRTT